MLGNMGGLLQLYWMFTVLITGGTGLVGGYITRHLQQEGFTVIYLSRKASTHKGIQC